MLLAIDAGNTDIVFALHIEGQWLHHWRIPSTNEASKEIWQYRLVSELLELGLQADAIQKAVLSSVVPGLSPLLAEMLHDILGHPAILVGADIYPLLNVKVQNPEEIGTDLVANAVAAFDRFQQACIAVDFGTALTFTTVSSKGIIEGVAIAPGLKTAVRTLFQKTAQLPEVPLKVPRSALGKNTEGAIQAGVVLGYVGLSNYLIEHIKKELKEPCKVIATGGLSRVLDSLSHSFDAIDPMLTLDGLRLIEEQCTA